MTRKNSQTDAFSSEPVVILGGGPAGMAAAVTLSRKGIPVVVVEKQNRLGGLAATIKHGDYTLDLGPHIYHRHFDEIDDLYRSFCPDGNKKFTAKAILHMRGKFFDYPLNFSQAFFHLDPAFTLRMVTDYLAAQFRRYTTTVSEDSFEAWGVKRYGRAMYDLAFGDYSRKVWGRPTSQLHWRLAHQKLPDLSWLDFLVQLLSKSKGSNGSSRRKPHLYPAGGSGVVFEAMGDAVRKAGGRIMLGYKPLEIKLFENRVDSVILEGATGHESIPCRAIINTIPLSDFIPCCSPLASTTIVHSAKKLSSRCLIFVFLEIDRRHVTQEIMIYLIDKGYRFNRIGEQKNLAPEMVPDGRSILCFEICSDENDKWWQLSDDDFLKIAREDLLHLGVVSKEHIGKGFVHRVKQAYPIFDLHFDEHLLNSLEWISRLENVFSIGRQGLFLNNDIHFSMKLGVVSARHFIGGRPHHQWVDTMYEQLEWRL